ncbi:MAG: serine hydrolase [Chryseolinea sp.]
MKSSCWIAVTLTIASCSPSKEPMANSNTVKVEKGLSANVYFQGDSTWTIEQRMKHYGVPGVSIAVIKDNKIDWIKTYGVMNKERKEPVTTKTLFQAGSISKPVAAYAALHVAEAGKINLDENINTYLKSWKLPENEFTADKKVALKHLLNHSGGITVHGFLGYSPDMPVPTLLQVLDGAPPANSPPIRIDKKPEESFRYSGGGYTIMQQMLIDIEGKPFPEILRDIVLQPIGMSNSTYEQPLTGSALGMAATGYVPDGTMTKGERHTYPEMAAAGLWTTAEDLALFAIDVQKTFKGESNRVVSKAMAKKMLTPFVSDFVGLGLFLTKRKDNFYFGHGGWDEGFSSEMLAHRDKGYGVVVLTNSNHPEFISELINSVARVYGWEEYLHDFNKVDMDTAQFALFKGRYYNGTDGSIRIFNKGAHLYLKYLKAPEADELIRISDSSYVTTKNARAMQFKINPKDGKLNVVFINKDNPIEFANPKLTENVKAPYEYLLEGDYKNSLKGYQALMKTNAADNAVNEDNINQQAYFLLQSNQLSLGKNLFKINMMLYPKSANTYDSYAEACMKNGDKALAIEYYKKAIKMNPENKGAKEKLAALEK